MDRRQAIFGLIAAVAAPEVLAGCVATDDEERLLQRGDGAVFYRPQELAFVSLLADAIIPATDTPGAVEAGVPATLDGLMAVWASPVTQDAHRRAIAQVEQRLGDLAGLDVIRATLEQRIAAVAALDAEAYADGGPPPGLSVISKGPGFGADEQPVTVRYRALKSLIAQAYYVSEAGATQELHYELVPTRWVADAPLAEVGRTWAE